VATDADRVLPGDGDYRLDDIVQELRRIGYERLGVLELMNPTLWQVRGTQVAEVGLAPYNDFWMNHARNADPVGGPFFHVHALRIR